MSTITDQFLERYAAGDADGMLALCRPDAVVDANVPQWRYQVHPDALRSQLRENGQMPDRNVTVEYHEATRDGAVVEVQTRGTHDGGPVLVREVWMVRTDGEKVTEWTFYCTGPWDTATIARQRAEAPMLRAATAG